MWRLFSNRVPPHPTSGLWELMTSLVCLTVMQSDLPKFVRAQIFLYYWDTYGLILLRPRWEIGPDIMSIWKLEGIPESCRAVITAGVLT